MSGVPVSGVPVSGIAAPPRWPAGGRAGGRADGEPVRFATRLAVGLAGCAVLAEVAYPLLSGQALDRLTQLSVVLFSAAGLCHAAGYRGPLWAARMFALFALGGFAVELIGVHTGVPFGRYAYSGALGVRLGRVPLLVALAWPMLGYPALVVGRRAGGASRAGRIGAAAVALSGWDLYLDPQLVRAGAWHWAASSWPRLAGVPLSNDLGWLLTALLLMTAAQWVCPPPVAHPDRPGEDRLPVALYTWTWAGSLLADLAFLHLPVAALCGGIGMGLPLAGAARRR